MSAYPPKATNSDTLPLHSAPDRPSEEFDSADHMNNFGPGALGHRRDKSAAGHPLRNLTPKRIAAVGAVLLLLIFWLGAGTRPKAVVGEDRHDSLNAPGRVSDELEGAEVPVAKLPPKSPQKLPSAGERKCTPPPGQKETTYALMIDAGSTGSRIHVYTFSHCDPTPGSLPKLEDEYFEQLKPGLSSFAGRPVEAAESLRPLLESAKRLVPAKEQSCTPIAVKATAGLRLTGEKESSAILRQIENWLNSEWPFSLVEDGVVVMEGKDEGVYAWITINFLLGLIGPGNSDPTASAAVMDLGGASTQIVFEPTFASKNAHLVDGDHVYDLDFAGTDHVLYQHSHLGYGLMQARRAVNNLVGFSHVWQSATSANPVNWDQLTTEDLVHNPCMFKGETKVAVLDPPGRKSVEVTMIGTGAGFEACRRVVEVMIAKDAACVQEPCAFAGVYQPKMQEVFSAGRVWALSYFYDRIAPLGLSSPFAISSLRKLTSDVCAGKDSPKWARFRNNKEAMEELSDRPEYCLDLTFMYSLLSLGYELEDEREIWIGKKVGDVELGWALGAALNMVEGHLSCRAD